MTSQMHPKLRSRPMITAYLQPEPVDAQEQYFVQLEIFMLFGPYSPQNAYEASFGRRMDNVVRYQ